jgi:peroxiredoxin
LARLKQDDAAKAQFEQYLELHTMDDPERQRIARYVVHPELARALMAPAFSVTTTEGQQISMDDLQGKVVLLDFWATWCAPCREALPHMRNVAKKFQGQPLVILSVSLDSDEGKWKEFIGKNEMTWPQYCDGGFTGPISKLFGVTANLTPLRSIHTEYFRKNTSVTPRSKASSRNYFPRYTNCPRQHPQSSAAR